jgi:addiction module RelE/StbE family toxin
MRVLWLDRAEADLDEIFEYLVERDRRAARRVLDTIRERVAQLGDQPRSGRPGRVAGTRELVITRTPYIVAYTIDPEIDAVVVLRVLHAARRWPDEM